MSKPLNLTPELKLSLDAAAANLSACGVGASKAAEAISRACDSPQTKGSLYKDLLHIKVAALRNLATLCDKGAKRLSDAAADAVQSNYPEDVLSELLALARFIGDQLRSEHADACRLLSFLRCGN